MTEFGQHLADYVALRRSVGFALKEADWLLPGFVRYLQEHDAEHVSTELALAFATLPTGVLPVTHRARLGAVRGFTQYLHNLDPKHQVPPQDVLPAHYSRVTPYLYSDEDVVRLIAAAAALTPAIRAHTFQTMIGLLAVSGLRLGEAIMLGRDDINYDRSLLVVRHAKLGIVREVPLHSSSLLALADHARLRDQHYPSPVGSTFFLNQSGRALRARTVSGTQRTLIAAAGLEPRGQRCRPRTHDLRHSFAVHTLIDWYRDGVDVDARMPLLSQVLGHVNPANTYWYLQAAPELLTLVAARLEPDRGSRR
jgi:integrase/recombinase XerD